MIKQRITYLISTLTLVLAGLVPATAGAVSSHGQQPALPEKAGIYSVPGHSKLKLRVFVHNAKGNPGKPGGSTPTPSLTCGLADTNSSTVDGLTGWKLPSGTWTYRLNTGSAPSLVGATGLTTAAANAFNAYTTTTDLGSSVNFTRGANTSVNKANYDGQNIISWGRTSGSALAVTYTWYNTSTGVVAEEDTIFNSKFSWAWSNQANCAYQGYYDAQNILTHELGHWMGLDDKYDSSFANNTMYGYGSPTEVKKNTLATGDVSAINSLY